MIFWVILLAINWLRLAHAGPPGNGIVPGRAFDRLITIWLENQDFYSVNDDRSFKDLKKHGELLTRYYAHTHPSQPNYLAAIAGDYFGLNHDDDVHIPENVSTIVDILEARDISWAGYFEGLPGPGFMYQGSEDKDGNWDYVRKHNPFVSFDSITMDGSRLLNILDFNDFKRGFESKTLPQFVFMSPNMLNDGHNTTLKYATDWAKEFLLPMLEPDAFKERTLIMLTYDEVADYSMPNRIATLLLGSALPDDHRGKSDHQFYTHYSMLSTIEYNWRLPNLGRYDVGANIFQYVANLTGYTGNRVPGNANGANNSVSYPGALNADERSFLPFPPPNLRLVGAGGLPVAHPIRDTWQAFAGADTPYDGSGDVHDVDRPPVYKPQAQNVQS